MKTITAYLLPRYYWFLLWFKQWFKNPDGIKGFATQAMNMLMQRTMLLAQRLKKRNKRMIETIRSKKRKLLKWYEHPVVGADEWDEIKSVIWKTSFWIFIGVLTEAACNYFAIQSVMAGVGLLWTILRMLVAIGLTGLCLYFFEKWFAVVINQPAYKQPVAKKRNWIELIILTMICIGFEIAFYWLCKRRSVALEGSNADNTITYFVIGFGLLLPIGAGYLAYARSRYVSAYKNTLRISSAEARVAKMESSIAGHNQRMEDHFKRRLQRQWAIVDEFRVYKGNYNEAHDLKHESLAGHFCETHEQFEKEAVTRYMKQMPGGAFDSGSANAEVVLNIPAGKTAQTHSN